MNTTGYDENLVTGIVEMKLLGVCLVPLITADSFKLKESSFATFFIKFI